MNIEEFEQQEIRSIHNFCTDWLDNHQADPEKYPIDLDILEWLDQYHCFNNTEYEDEHY